MLDARPGVRKAQRELPDAPGAVSVLQHKTAQILAVTLVALLAVPARQDGHAGWGVFVLPCR
jgi:hypothetical protein